MDLKEIAEAYQNVYEKKLDPVGKEDGDVDNDGDKDSSDSYLMKRRKAITKAMKKEEIEKEEVQQMDEFVGAALGALGGAALGKTALAKGLTTAAAAKAASIPTIGGAVSKALGSKIAPQVVGSALGAGAGEAIDPFKKTKDKDVVKAAALGGAAPAVGSAIGGMLKKEHHQKDADGKVIEHEVRQEDQELYKAFADAAPSSVEEEKTVLSKLTENGEELDMFDAVVAYLIDEGFAETLEEAQKIMSGLKPELVEEVYQSQLEKIQKSTPSENDEVQQMDEFVSAALGALNTANKVANVVNTASAIADKMKKKKKEDNVEEMVRMLVPKDGANVRRAPKPDTAPKPVPPKPSPKPDTAPEPEKKPSKPSPSPEPIPPKKPAPRPTPQPRP